MGEWPVGYFHCELRAYVFKETVVLRRCWVLQDNLVFSTQWVEDLNCIGHRKEIWKLTSRELALRRNELLNSEEELISSLEPLQLQPTQPALATHFQIFKRNISKENIYTQSTPDSSDLQGEVDNGSSYRELRPNDQK